MDKCLVCNEYVLISLRSHKCKPSWLVRYDDYDPDETHKVFAPDAPSAAEKYVEQQNSWGADYPAESTVVVERNGHEWRLLVTLEAVPEYTAYDADEYEKPGTYYTSPARDNIPKTMAA